MFRQSSHPQPNIVHHQIFIKHKWRRVSAVWSFFFCTLILWWTIARTDAHSSDYHKHRLPIERGKRERERGTDANAQNQQNEAELVHSLSSSIDVQIPGTWMHLVLAWLHSKREKLSWWKVCFHFLISSFGSVCRRIVIHMRDRSTWGERADARRWGDI